MNLLKSAFVCIAIAVICGCDQGQPTPPPPTPPPPTPPAPTPDEEAIANPHFLAQKKRAESGNAIEQYNLGVTYLYGSKDVPKDYAKAMKWFRLSADQGFVSSQHNLGLMYRYGKGVPKDYVEAYVWLAVAATDGNAIIVKERDLVASKLTPEQLSGAKKRAAELLEK